MRAFFCLALSLVLVSCNSAAVNEFENFDSNRWEKSQPMNFEFEIPDAGDYGISLKFSHVFGGLPIREIPINVSLKKGNTEVYSGDSFVGILNDSGNETGDCTGDICDTDVAVFTTTRLAAGKYTMTLSQNTAHEVLPNVIGIGIEVNKAGN